MNTRLTIACPQALISDANHLAMVLGYSEADSLTYGSPDWKDADGNLYTVASLPVSNVFFSAAFQALQRPEWDTDEIVDLTAASRAQAAISLADLTLEPNLATPDKLLAFPGDDALASVAAMGLTRTV